MIRLAVTPIPSASAAPRNSVPIHATISGDEGTLEVWPSEIWDPMASLTEAVSLLLNGAERAEARWQDEPGEYRWLFERDGERVTVRILRFRDTHSRKLNADGKLLFRTTCRLAELAGQVMSQLDRLGVAPTGLRMLVKEHRRARRGAR